MPLNKSISLVNSIVVVFVYRMFLKAYVAIGGNARYDPTTSLSISVTHIHTKWLWKVWKTSHITGQKQFSLYVRTRTYLLTFILIQIAPIHMLLCRPPGLPHGAQALSSWTAAEKSRVAWKHLVDYVCLGLIKVSLTSDSDFLRDCMNKWIWPGSGDDACLSVGRSVGVALEEKDVGLQLTIIYSID